jgi:hypothetical protein
MGRIGQSDSIHQRFTTSSGIFSTRTGKKVEALIGVICLFGIDLKLPDVQMVK